MIRAHVGVVTSIQKDAAVFLHEWRFLSEERRTRCSAGATPTRRSSATSSPKARRSGDFREVDPRLTAAAILSSLNGIATWYSPDGPLTRTAA